MTRTSELFVTSTPSNNPAPTELTALDKTLYFVADDGIHGHELWKSDGSESGTVMVKDIFPGHFSALLK